MSGGRRSSSDIDQGWAWVVLISDFLVSIMLGLVYAGGIFNIIFLEVFDMNKQNTAWIATSQSSILGIAGVLGSFITSHLGPRWTLVLGGLIGATGYILTAVATNIVFVYISFGIIVGVGLGICFVPCMCLVSDYFDKYRNFAFGVVSTALGVGTMILPPLITTCNELYGWRGCMLILAGFLLQFLVCGALLRPPSRAGIDENIPVLPQATSHLSDEADNLGSALSIMSRDLYGALSRPHNVKYLDKTAVYRSTPNALYCDVNLSRRIQCIKPDDKSEHHQSLFSVVEGKEAVTFQPNIIIGDRLHICDTPAGNKSYSMPNGMHLLDGHAVDIYPICWQKENRDACMLSSEDKSAVLTSTNSRPISADPDVHLGSSQLDQVHLVTSVDGDDRNQKQRPPAKYQLYRLGIMCNKPGFILLCIAMFCVNGTTLIAYIHVPNYFLIAGSSKSMVSLCFSVVGSFSILGRIFGAVATNHNDIDEFVLFISSCGITGALMCLSPLLSHAYSTQMVFAVIFGFYGNWCYSTLAPVTLQVVGKDDLSLAFGIEHMFGGIGGLIGPPFAGWLFDVTGTYDYTMYLSGCLYAVAMLCAMLVPVCTCKRRTILEATEIMNTKDTSGA